MNVDKTTGVGLDTINSFFDQSLEYNIEGPKAVGWSNRYSQYGRFQILREVGDLTDQSILDVGCGLGDFYQFLTMENIDIKEYKGIDINKEMLHKARERFIDVPFSYVNLLSEKLSNSYDYVFASGIFNISCENWDEITYPMLKKMFTHCNKAVAVNFLSNYSTGERSDISHYCSPADMLTFALEELSKKVVLRHDYRVNDFSLFIYR